MLEEKPANAEQYEVFLQLMHNQAAAYLESTLALMEIGWEQFGQLFRTVGQVYGVYVDGELAGFYWIEKREAVLHLHGLVLKEAFQGQGLGTRILHGLASRYRDSVIAIELGVHESNRRAGKLYEKLGYETVMTLDDLGFTVMRKQLSGLPN